MGMVPSYRTTGRRPILDEIDRVNGQIGELEKEIRSHERQVSLLQALLRFSECPKCGAEREGGVRAAEEMAQVAKLVGRADVPCSFCDTAEQKEAVEKALERIAH